MPQNPLIREWNHRLITNTFFICIISNFSPQAEDSKEIRTGDEAHEHNSNRKVPSEICTYIYLPNAFSPMSTSKVQLENFTNSLSKNTTVLVKIKVRREL